MQEFTLPALVIRETDIGEQDKLLTLLTGERGRLQAKVHGARNIKSKNMACSSLFCYGTFAFSEKNGRITVKESSLTESFFNLRLNIENLALANYIAEVLCTVSTEQNDETELLILALNSLFALNKAEKPTRLIKAAFELRCLAILGFRPDLSACFLCGTKEAHPFYFDCKEGTLVCHTCKSPEHGGYVTSSDVLCAMRYILSSPPKRIFAFSISDKALWELGNICEQFFLSQTETHYKSLKFYHSMES